MIVIISKYLVPGKYRGIAIFPFVFLKSKAELNNAAVLNHERIHFWQQLELLVLVFYVWYGLEFLIRWAKTGNWHKAYRSISFEKEAYAHENDPNYLKNRKIWSFLRYL